MFAWIKNVIQQLFTSNVETQKKEILDYMDAIENASPKLIGRSKFEVRDGRLFLTMVYEEECEQ